MRKLRKKLLLSLVLICAFLTISCHCNCLFNGSDSLFYKALPHANQIELALSRLTLLKTTIETEEGKVIKSTDSLAIPLQNGLILSLSHAALSIGRPVSRIQSSIAIYRRFFIGDTELRLIGALYDIALFECLNGQDYVEPFPFSFGDSSKLHLGTQVLIPTWSGYKGFHLKSGIISSVDYRSIASIYRSQVCIRGRDKCMILESAAFYGNSGSPVLAYTKKGQLEIVAVVCGKFGDEHGLGLAYPINFVKELMEEILDV